MHSIRYSASKAERNVSSDALKPVVDALTSLKAAIAAITASVGIGVGRILEWLPDTNELAIIIPLICTVVLCCVQVGKYLLELKRDYRDAKAAAEISRQRERNADLEAREKELRIEAMEFEKQQRIEKAKLSPCRREDDPK